MKAIALACETIADEVRLAARETRSTIPICWVKSGMHNYPIQLKQHIQAEINRVENVDHILLLFGYCGNSLLGLKSDICHLVIPKVDDCVSLLLGGNAQRNNLNDQAMGYYLTKGWLSHEYNLWSEYNYCLQKYGSERTSRIYRVMLHNYKRLNVINTGAYNLDDLLPLTGQIARELELDHTIVDGSLDLLGQALKGEWTNHRFVVIEPGEEVTMYNLGILHGTGEKPWKLNMNRTGG